MNEQRTAPLLLLHKQGQLVWFSWVVVLWWMVLMATSPPSARVLSLSPPSSLSRSRASHKGPPLLLRATPQGQTSKIVKKVVLYAGNPEKYPAYKRCLQQALEELHLQDCIRLTDNLDEDPSSIDYIIYHPQSALQDFTPYNDHVQAIFHLQAGANAVTQNPTLSPTIPLTRMLDSGLQQGMVEYVVGHVLRVHLSTDWWWEVNRRHRHHHLKNSNAPPQQEQPSSSSSSSSSLSSWGQQPANACLASERTVGILGLGQLGQACATALARLNFDVCGWSRTPKTENEQLLTELPGIRCFHGDDALDTVLQQSDILVLLLPDTEATRNLIHQGTLSKCKRGVHLINAGRGTCIVEPDLLQALDDGHVASATCDVFVTEPLPVDHPFWHHARVLVTPHIAAKSRASTAARVICQNIQRAERGEPLLYQVDRTAGY